jgi:hypothetical protein
MQVDSFPMVVTSGSWNPRHPALAEAARSCRINRAFALAREHAETTLGIDQMVDEYLKVLLG